MIPPAVLAAYPPPVRDCTWVPLPPGGGLNGGRVWRGERCGNPLFALKREVRIPARPAIQPTANHFLPIFVDILGDRLRKAA